MAEIRIVRTARKAHDCGAYPCTRTIQPGTRYLLCSLPPRDEDNESDRWLRMKVCEPCATCYGKTLDEQVTPRRSHARRAPARRVRRVVTVELAGVSR